MGGLRMVGAMLLLVVAALALDGCGGDDKRPAPKRTPATTETPAATESPAQPEPVASTQSSVEDADEGGLRFDLMSLNRVGDVVVAQIRLYNEADEDISIGSNLLGGSFTKTPPGGYSDVSGFALADPVSRRLYTVLREPGGDCICTNTDALEDPFLDPGKDITVYAAFPAPPASSGTVTVVNPIGPPFPPVPIDDGEPPQLPRADELPDLTALAPDEPVVLPITSLADSLDKTRSVAENDREVEIRLSTDVLFALNSARLSPRARGVLAAAARELEKANAHTVRAEGHADSSGNDAINDPLSKRRADAVARALKPLVGRDVSFTTRGFGSRRPVASNDEPEGRRRNRRVSIVFARPAADEPPAPDTGGTATEGEPASGKSVEVKGRNATAGQSVTVQLESLEANGSLAVLTYVVRNTGDEDAILSSLLGSDLDDTYRFGRNSITGPTLVDPASRQRFFVAAVPVDDDEICLCSDTAGAHLGLDIFDPGATGRFHASYVVPTEAKSVTVEMGPKSKLGHVAIDRGE